MSKAKRANQISFRKYKFSVGAYEIQSVLSRSVIKINANVTQTFESQHNNYSFCTHSLSLYPTISTFEAFVSFFFAIMIILYDAFQMPGILGSETRVDGV